MTGTAYTGRGASGPSIDQILAAKIGAKSRFHSLQIGVAQESHGENVHRNMSWAGYDRALPPEMIPQNLFDRLVRREGPELGRPQEEHSRPGAQRCGRTEAGSGPGGPAASRRASDFGAGSGTRHRQPAARLRQESQGAGGHLRPDGLSEDRQDPIRSAGPRLRLRADARRVLHADQVPEPDALPLARLIGAIGITITRTTMPARPSSSAFCATSRAGTSRSSPTSCSA